MGTKFKTVFQKEKSKELLQIVVIGNDVTLHEATESAFFGYFNEGTYFIIENTTGLSVAKSEISMNDAIFNANETIKRAKIKGVFFKRLLEEINILAKNNITTPLNKIPPNKSTYKPTFSNKNNVAQISF